MAFTLISVDNKEKRLLIFASVAHSVSDAWHLIYPALLFLIALEYDNFFFLGVLANIVIVSRALSGVLAGFLADRFSNRLLLAAFALLCALGSFMVYLSQNQFMLALSLFVLGVGTGIYHPVGLSSISRNIRRRTEALGIHEAAGAIGLSVFPVILVSVGVATGWRSSFLLASIVSLALLPMLPLVPKEFDVPRRPPAAERKAQPRLWEIFGRRPVILLYAAAILLEAPQIGFMTFLPIAIAVIGGLEESQVLGISTTGLFISLAILVGAVGSFIGGWLGGLFAPERVLSLLLLVPIPLLLLLGVAEGNVLLALAPIVRVPFNATAPLLNTMIGKYLPVDAQGRGFAVLYGLGPVVGSLVALLAGAIAQTYGLNWVFPVMAVFLLIASPLPFLMLLPVKGGAEPP